MHPSRLLTVRVLHGYRYIGAQHVASMIRSIPRVCDAKPYLECVVQYNEARYLCEKFADALGDRELRYPDVFLERFDADMQNNIATDDETAHE